MSPTVRCKSAILGTLLVCLIAFSFLPNVSSADVPAFTDTFDSYPIDIINAWKAYLSTDQGGTYAVDTGILKMYQTGSQGRNSAFIGMTNYTFTDCHGFNITSRLCETSGTSVAFLGLVGAGNQGITQNGYNKNELALNYYYVCIKSDNANAYVVYRNGAGDSEHILHTQSKATNIYYVYSIMIDIVGTIDFYINGVLVHQEADFSLDCDTWAVYMGGWQGLANSAINYYDYVYLASYAFDTVQTSLTIGAPDILTTLNLNAISGAIAYVLDTIRTVINYIETEVIELAHTTILAYFGTVYELILQVTSFIQVGLGNVLAHTITYFKCGIATILDFITTHIPIAKTLLDSITVVMSATAQYLAHIDAMIKSVLDTYEDEPLGFVVAIIPVLLILLVPTLIMRHYVGEIAVMPMFAFMSIVCYIGQLIPLWITIIVLIGTVVIMFRGRLSRGAT